MTQTTPTVRHKKAFKEVVNGSTISKAMVKVGYSAETAKRTNKLTRTKGWQLLLKQHLPDSVLAKRHREMLNKKEKMIVSDGAGEGSHIEDTNQPHSDVNRALEMAYKLKGVFPKEGDGGSKTLILVVSGESAQRYGVLPTRYTENSSN